jgi:hypothetical protein
MALGRWAALPCIGVEPGYAACAIVIAFGTMPVANLTNIALSAELTAGLALKAPIADPTFTGTVTIPTLAVGTAATVPTATVGDSDTTAASTAFVMQAVGLVVSVAEDAAAAILNTTSVLYLLSSAAGDKAITVTSTRANQRLDIVLVAASGGSYTLAVTGGALTLNAAGETPELVRNAANDAWLVLRLNGATIV